MSNGIDRVAFKLVEPALSRLVVRAALYPVIDFPDVPVASIYLLSYCQPREERYGRLFEVEYFSRQDPTTWYESEGVVEVRSLHPKLIAPNSTPENLVEPARKMGERLLDWQEHHPLWDSGKEVAAYVQGSFTKPHEAYPSNLRLMLHFTRLHALLLERGHHTPNAWETDDLLKRLGAFLKDRMQDWEKVIG